LVAIGGLSGTGKTTQALLLAPLLGKAPGAMVIRADVVRKRLLGVDLSARLGQDGYSLQTTQRVYSAMTAVAERTIRAGQAVIIDAVAARPEERSSFAAACARAAAPFTGFWLQAPLALRAKRVASRRGDPSDADVAAVHAEEGWEIGANPWRVLDAAEPPEIVHGEILAELQGSEP
jgi:predicted kinase